MTLFMETTINENVHEIGEDHDWILRSQNGDKNAFGLIVQKYMKRAYFTALGFVGSHEHALDLSQEAFVRAYRAIKKLDANRKFFTWYYAILRNLCFNHQRDTAKHARSFSEIGEQQVTRIVDTTNDPLRSTELHELQTAVWQALDKLRDSEKEIILLRDFQGFSYLEIAEFLNIPKGTVMSRLYNARMSLKSLLSDIV